MKKLNNAQIKSTAEKFSLGFAQVKAVVEVEASGSGFIGDLPKILFEPHVFYRRLGEMGYISLREKMRKINPKLIYPVWRTYPYGKTHEQHNRLNEAIEILFKVLPNLDKNNPDDKKIIDDVRAAALESCSWGLGQIMGYHWKTLGYPSLQAFINAMYASEEEQLDAMMRFIKTRNLIPYLKNLQWAKFARAYNGVGYAKNKYDVKLAAAYNKYK